MSHTNLHDFEAEYTHEDANVGLRVQVEKRGGGTVGRTYQGNWRYIVTRLDDSTEVARGQDYTAGMPRSHAYVARELVEYFPIKSGGAHGLDQLSPRTRRE